MYKVYYNDNGIVTFIEKHNEFFKEGEYILSSLKPEEILNSVVVNNSLYVDKEKGFRLVRNNKLLESDWTQLPNNHLDESKRQEWNVYRQHLRDITLQTDYPNNVVFPDKPN